jgi:serine/threonine-protein kinase RsbW
MGVAQMATELTISSDLAEARRVQERIAEVLTASAYSEHDIFAIKLALEEALVNAIKHGNQMDPDKRVFIVYHITTERFDIRITDEGEGFNPEDVPDPTEEPFVDRPCGRGLLLMRGFMTEVQYHGKGNIVSMSKVRETAS